MQKKPLLEVNNLKTWFANQRNFVVKSSIRGLVNGDFATNIFGGKNCGFIAEILIAGQYVIILQVGKRSEK